MFLHQKAMLIKRNLTRPFLTFYLKIFITFDKSMIYEIKRAEFRISFSTKHVKIKILRSKCTFDLDEP